MSTLHLKFDSCLRLRFPVVETNPGPRRPVAASCRILCSNVRGLSGNLSDLAVAPSQYDMLLCSETLVSDLRHVPELLVPGFGRPVLLCRDGVPRQAGASCLVPVGWRHMYEIDMEHFVNQNLSVVVVKCWLLGFVV